MSLVSVQSTYQCLQLAQCWPEWANKFAPVVCADGKACRCWYRSSERKSGASTNRSARAMPVGTQRLLPAVSRPYQVCRKQSPLRSLLLLVQRCPIGDAASSPSRAALHVWTQSLQRASRYNSATTLDDSEVELPTHHMCQESSAG